MKHLKLSLLFAVAMMSLCPSVAHAWQSISGSWNVSSLSDERILLTGNTTLTVNQDWYLREISGVNYKLTLVLNGSYTLTVDQNNSNLAAIDVTSLDISGSGNLLCTGRNFGGYIRGGSLNIHNYSGTAAFHGRDSYASHGVWVTNNATVVISSGTVNFQAGPGYGLGGSGKLTVTGSNTVVNVSSNQDGINFANAVNDGNINVTGASLNIYGKRYAIYCSELYLNSGSVLEASNGDSYDAVYTTGFYATESTARVTGVGNGISTSVLTTQDAYINAYGGNRAYGIYARPAPAGSNGADGYLWFKGMGTYSQIYADGDYGGLYSADFIRFDNRYVYAKARRSGCSAIAAMGNLSFNHNAYSVYQAESASYPFYAGGEIRMYEPFNDRFSQIYNLMTNTSRYDISSDKHYFVTYTGSGASTSTTAFPGYVCIKGPSLYDANVDMSETLWAKYNGYYQSRPAAAYKGEEVMFKEPTLLNDYVLHNPTNNPVTNYPNPAPVRTVKWYRVNDTGMITQVGTGDTYTPTAADVGYRLKAMVTYSSHQGAIYSSDLPVVAKQNNNTPVQPVLYIYNSSTSTNRYVCVNPAYVDQEYIVLTTQKEISELTESDWANAISPTSQGILKMCDADYDHTYYVYTRFKATDTYAPGSKVEYSSISGGTSVNYQGIHMTAKPMNGATLTPDDMGYCCLKNTVVKITISPVPYNATNFNGVLGSGLSISRPSNSSGTQWNNECGALYADAACTQSLVSNQYYKTVYAKLVSNIDQLNYGYTCVNAYLAGYTDRIKFVVANDNGTWDPFSIDLAMGASHELRFKKGCSVTQAFTVQPAMADISNLTVEYVGYTGSLTNPTPPIVTVNTQAKTYTVSNYQATTDENGKYRFNFKVGDRIVAYLFVVVEKRPVESITVSPHEATLDPLVGQLQLQATIYSEYAEDEIVWASSAPSIIAVDENGLVTLTNANSALGETYLITATAGDFTDTCVVHVGGEKYQLWVRNTQVNSLNQLDILGMAGGITYSNGVLTLNGVTLGSTTYTYPIIRSEMPNLTIDLKGTNKITVNNTTAAIISTVGNIAFTGDGNLTISNRNTTSSGGIVAKNLIVSGNAQVTVAGAVYGVLAQNGLTVNYGAQLRTKGSTASVRAMGFLDGVITEPFRAHWNSRTGYVTYAGVNGDIVANDYVTIVGEEPEPTFTRGDVNDDGNVNISDVTALINYLLSGDASQINIDAADCNQDSNVNISDVTTLINFLLSGAW